MVVTVQSKQAVVVEQSDLWPWLGPTFCKHGSDYHIFICSGCLRSGIDCLYNESTSGKRLTSSLIMQVNVLRNVFMSS